MLKILAKVGRLTPQDKVSWSKALWGRNYGSDRQQSIGNDHHAYISSSQGTMKIYNNRFLIETLCSSAWGHLRKAVRKQLNQPISAVCQSNLGLLIYNTRQLGSHDS